jgi:hypothetical protein
MLDGKRVMVLADPHEWVVQLISLPAEKAAKQRRLEEYIKRRTNPSIPSGE